MKIWLAIAELALVLVWSLMRWLLWLLLIVVIIFRLWVQDRCDRELPVVSRSLSFIVVTGQRVGGGMVIQMTKSFIDAIRWGDRRDW